jgi:hypothetical protein
LFWRLVLEDSQMTGWSVALASPDAILLIPAYLLIAAGLFLVLARWQRRRLGWRDRDPEPWRRGDRNGRADVE